MSGVYIVVLGFYIDHMLMKGLAEYVLPKYFTFPLL